MADHIMRPDMLGLLYEQHRNYNAQLALNHQSLGKLYSKLAKAEHVLAERRESKMNRSSTKKWQYTKILTKRNIERLEARSRELQDHTRQCNNLITSIEHQGSHRSSESWPGSGQPSPYLFSPFTPGSYSHWPSVSHGSILMEPESQPQYWDLSMLPERHSYSPRYSLTDSGFQEPPAIALGMNEPWSQDPDHVYAHEIMSELSQPPPTAPRFAPAGTDPPIAQMPIFPARIGASQHKRCFSADDPVPRVTDGFPAKKRGTSVGPVAS